MVIHGDAMSDDLDAIAARLEAIAELPIHRLSPEGWDAISRAAVALRAAAPVLTALAEVRPILEALAGEGCDCDGEDYDVCWPCQTSAILDGAAWRVAAGRTAGETPTDPTPERSRCGNCGGTLGDDHRCVDCRTQHNGPGFVPLSEQWKVIVNEYDEATERLRSTADKPPGPDRDRVPPAPPEPAAECNGICLWASDVGVAADCIAYAHPDCPLHGTAASPAPSPTPEAPDWLSDEANGRGPNPLRERRG